MSLGALKRRDGRCRYATHGGAADNKRRLKDTRPSFMWNLGQSPGPRVRDGGGSNGSLSVPGRQVSGPRSQGERDIGAWARSGVPQEHQNEGAQGSDTMVARTSVRPPFWGHTAGLQGREQLVPPFLTIEGTQVSPRREENSIRKVLGGPRPASEARLRFRRSRDTV